MGRKSNYANMHAKEHTDISFESVKQKFGIEKMSPAEFAAYISGLDETHIPSITEKSVRNYISNICSSSNGLLKITNFKNNEGLFELQPEYHGLLLTLIDSIYFDGRKKPKRLSNKAALQEQLLKNIDKYLSEDEQKIIRSTPAYPNAVLDQQLTFHLETELSHLIHWLYHTDDLFRYQAMRDFILQLISTRKALCTTDSMLSSAKMVYMHEVDDLKDAKYRREMFESSSLAQFIIQYLAAKVHNEKFQYPPDEELSAAATTLATRLFCLTTENNKLQQMINQIDNAVKNQKKYQDIMNRISSVLNLSDPIERELHRAFSDLAYIQFFRPEIHPEDYKKTRHFLEACIKENKWFLIDNLVKLGRSNYTPEQLQDILSAQQSEK